MHLFGVCDHAALPAWLQHCHVNKYVLIGLCRVSCVYVQRDANYACVLHVPTTALYAPCCTFVWWKVISIAACRLLANKSLIFANKPLILANKSQ